MVKKTMPMPPIHCMTLRQKSMPRGMEERLSMMVAPVLVKPDMVSKKALAMSGTQWQKRNGSMPMKEKRSHTMETTMYPSLRPMVFCSLRPQKTPMVPVTAAMRMGKAKVAGLSP